MMWYDLCPALSVFKAEMLFPCTVVAFPEVQPQRHYIIAAFDSTLLLVVGSVGSGNISK